MKRIINILTRKRETSKKILIYCEIVTAVSVMATFIAAFFGVNTDALATVDTALITLCGAAHSFYYWKSKAENLKKFDQADKITMDEGDDLR